MSPSQTKHLHSVLQLNLLLVLLHALVYSGVLGVLQQVHNPFADGMIVAMLLAPIGIYLCFDYIMSGLCEILQRHDYVALRPVGAGLAISLLPFVAMVLWPAELLEALASVLAA